METTRKIDADIASLHGELGRHGGKIRFHCSKKCKYVFGILALLLLMTAFGVATQPSRVAIDPVEEIFTVPDQAANITPEEVRSRLGILLEGAGQGNAASPASTDFPAAEPAVYTWAPSAAMKKDEGGRALPVTGRYSIPAGWFGAVHLLANGEIVGTQFIDARRSSGGQGVFAIQPTRSLQRGERIQLAIDGVEGCRLACGLTDPLCMSTNANYCGPRYSNERFIEYRPYAPILPASGY